MPSAVLLAGCGVTEPPAEPAKVAAPAAAPAPPRPASWRFHAIGTEPFWGADTEEDKLTWSTPESPQGTLIETTVSTADAGTTPGAVRLSWYGKLGEALFRLEIEPGRCSDGMSDKAYAYSAKVVIGSDTRSGCAEPR